MLLMRNKHNKELHLKDNGFMVWGNTEDFDFIKKLDINGNKFGLTTVSHRNLTDIINWYNKRIQSKYSEYERLVRNKEYLRQIQEENM